MKQHYLVIDSDICHDCNNCFTACKDEFVMNDWMPYTEEQPRHGHRWINIHRKERGSAMRVEANFLPMPCQHCADAPCIKAHPDCISRREDGIVLIDPNKARGKKEIADSCPYEAIYWNEDKNVAQKCTLCAHLLDDGWGITRCAHSCPTNAITYHYLEPQEMEKMIQEEKLEAYRGELGTKPTVYYKNLYKFTKNFITGAIIKDDDCLEGAKIVLKGKNRDEDQVTDYFGEFKFDGLEPGEYTLELDGAELQKVSVLESVNVGNIYI